MMIKKITFKNFRSFTFAEVIFDKRNTVVLGINGSGKSTLLRGINLLYSDVINNVVNREELRTEYDTSLDDIRNGEPDATIEGLFEYNG